MRSLPNTQLALYAILFISVVVISTVGLYMLTDDCPPLVENPERWNRLQQEWQAGNVVTVMRHTTDCDWETESDCIEGNEKLTKTGELQAITIGEGLRRTLGSNFNSHHSILNRTQTTAALAFGESAENLSISKPCKDTLQSYLESFPSTGNEVFVTHSSCINSIKSRLNTRILGFSVAQKPHFGIAAFFKRRLNAPDELLGCVWPADWSSLSEG